MYIKVQDVCKYRYFYTNLTLFCLFSIYIIYYYETILISQGYGSPKIMDIFMDLRDVMGVIYPKFSPRRGRNKSQKFKPCRDKKCNI
jgi:hypothetical protein